MDNAVIVRPLIAEAPITAFQGINIPTIEKILVDIVADKEFEYANGAEMYHIYKNVFEAVDVNQKKMLRYASRRNKKQIIEQILTSNNV
jgi:predicted transcriptional regulator of viral defense system